MFGTGPLTSLGGVEAIGFIPTKYANRSIDFPDIEFHIVSGNYGSDGGRSVRRVHNIGDEAWMKVWRQLSFKDAFSIIPLLLRPKSVGNIKLRSKNPFVYPYINAGYFNHPEDIKVLVEGSLLQFFAQYWNIFWCSDVTILYSRPAINPETS